MSSVCLPRILLAMVIQLFRQYQQLMEVSLLIGQQHDRRLPTYVMTSSRSSRIQDGDFICDVL
jgi:hypothetical protein